MKIDDTIGLVQGIIAILGSLIFGYLLYKSGMMNDMFPLFIMLGLAIIMLFTFGIWIIIDWIRELQELASRLK